MDSRYFRDKVKRTCMAVPFSEMGRATSQVLGKKSRAAFWILSLRHCQTSNGVSKQRSQLRLSPSILPCGPGCQKYKMCNAGDSRDSNHCNQAARGGSESPLQMLQESSKPKAKVLKGTSERGMRGLILSGGSVWRTSWPASFRAGCRCTHSPEIQSTWLLVSGSTPFLQAWGFRVTRKD